MEGLVQGWQDFSCFFSPFKSYHLKKAVEIVYPSVTSCTVGNGAATNKYLEMLSLICSWLIRARKW